MTTLKEAQKDPKKMQKFIEEHKQDEPCDSDKFDAILHRMASQKKKPTHQTSSQDFDENCSDTQTR